MRKAALFNWFTYRFTSRCQAGAVTPRWKVGIYKADRLGDFVLSLGAIRAIVDVVGAKHCVLLHSAACTQLARCEFPDITCITLPDLDGKLWVTRRRFKQAGLKERLGGGIDQLICLRHFRTLFDELALQMIPSREVWCVVNSNVFSLDYELVRKRFEGDRIVDRPETGQTIIPCEDLRCHEKLLNAWSADLVKNRDLLPRLDRVAVARRKILALAPFGSNSIRDLPLGGVVACVKHAKVAVGLEAVLLTPPNALGQYENYARQLALAGAAVRIQITATIPELIDTLAASTAVLTTETATAHLATALDLPMVCVVGGGHYGLFSPWRRSERQIWLTHELPCFGCGWQCHHPEPYCITRVMPGQMVDAFQRVLNLSAVLPSSV